MQREGVQASTLAWMLLQLGWIALRADDKARAADALEESLAIFREVGEFEPIPQVLNALGDAALARGDHPAARVRFQESRALCRELGTPGMPPARCSARATSHLPRAIMLPRAGAMRMQ
jgi:hypothetical protein